MRPKLQSPEFLHNNTNPTKNCKSQFSTTTTRNPTRNCKSGCFHDNNNNNAPTNRKSECLQTTIRADITNSHQNSTNRWQGLLFFSFFFWGEFSHFGDKSFWKWGVKRGAQCFVAKSLGCQRRIEVENFTCSITLPMQLAKSPYHLTSYLLNNSFALNGAQ